MLDNIDAAALQLSRMLKVMDQPFTRVVLNREGEETQEEKIAKLQEWGNSKEKQPNKETID